MNIPSKTRTIHCPKCETALKRVELEPSLMIDKCPDCKGAWLDKGELAAITGVPDSVFRWKEALDSGTPTEHSCPACPQETSETVLKEVRFSAQGMKLKIDLCSLCTGLFLDDGELPAFHEMIKKLRVAARGGKTI